MTMTMTSTVLLRRLIKETLRGLAESNVWSDERDDDPTVDDEELLNHIMTYVVGGSSVEDDDIVREVIEAVRSSKRANLRSMSDDYVEERVRQYLADERASGDWD